MGIQRINALGLEIIRVSEGKRNHAYQSMINVKLDIPTIGYGHTKGVRMGDWASDDQCEKFLLADLEDTENQVNNLKLPLNNNQFSALVSFTFEEGIGHLLSSTLLKRIKANPLDETIRDAFMMWDTDGHGHIVNGEKTRRQKEADLYFS